MTDPPTILPVGLSYFTRKDMSNDITCKDLPVIWILGQSNYFMHAFEFPILVRIGT